MPETDLRGVVGDRFAVIAPHPDDESLGCGGMIAEACRRGWPPDIVVLTDGSASHPKSVACPPPMLAAIRRRETRRAMKCLKVPPENLHFLDFRDGGDQHDAGELADAAQKICALVEGCETLLVSWRHDPHGDHLTAYLVARLVARELGVRLLEYPIWGLMLAADTVLPDNAWRGWRVPVADHLATKRRAIACHESQHGQVIYDDPHGFVLPPSFLESFDQDWEILMEAA